MNIFQYLRVLKFYYLRLLKNLRATAHHIPKIHIGVLSSEVCALYSYFFRFSTMLRKDVLEFWKKIESMQSLTSSMFIKIIFGLKAVSEEASDKITQLQIVLKIENFSIFFSNKQHWQRSPFSKQQNAKN
jgi:hypothetical protein